MKNKISNLKFSFLLSLGLFLLLFQSCQNQNTQSTFLDTTEDKQKGAHVFGHLDSTNLQPLLQHNFEWITLVPWAGQKKYDSEKMVYSRGDSLRMIRRDSAWRRKIGLVHAAGLKVFLKPHVWIDDASDGKWRSDIFPTSEENWNLWSKNYREFILHYAKIAEGNNVELFCVGTEFTRLSTEKSAFWKSLIKEVRSIYSGKLTYAANWYDEYEKITFWDQLDYIGVQAYFPLTKNMNPTVNEISNGWNKYLPTLASISKKYNRKILFTEMGYKSTTDSAIEPWQWMEYEEDHKFKLSFETQANCYESFFDSVWEKEWFAGVHIWQWRSDFEDGNYGDSIELDFMPHGKPAAKVIMEGFE